MEKLSSLHIVHPEHAMWLMRARTLGFEIVTNDEFARAPLRSQELYISKVRQAILEYRQSNPPLKQLLVQADSSITHLVVHLKLALSYCDQEALRSEYTNLLTGHSINATTFYIYQQKILEAVEIIQQLEATNHLQGQIQQAYTESQAALNALHCYLYPKQNLYQQLINNLSKVYKQFIQNLSKN